MRRCWSYDDVECVKETKQAVLVTSPSLEETWIPKSVLSEDSDVYGEGHEGTLIVHYWWAVENMPKGDLYKEE